MTRVKSLRCLVTQATSGHANVTKFEPSVIGNLVNVESGIRLRSINMVKFGLRWKPLYFNFRLGLTLRRF